MKSLVFLLLVIISVINSNAQESIPASGGNATGTEGSVSYSVGQTFYSWISGTNGSIIEGVQVPYEISIIDGLKEALDINLICIVFPNPATDLLTLRIEHHIWKNLSYKLFDINGKVLENMEINSTESSITMIQFAAGTYFLKVYDNRKEIKTFKIIKN